jgi:transketolase
MCFQDLAIMRAMPNMQVFSPCDAYELRSLMNYMTDNYGGMYMQLLRQQLPAVFDDTYQFEPGRARTIIEGKDVTLIATGYTTHFALQAARELQSDGISVELLHCPSIKPFPVNDVVESAKKTGSVVTVENQNIIGGLGSAVCETLSEHYPVKVKRLGVPDRFGEVATEEYLLDKHGFGTKHIKDACRELSKRK